jgi:glycosyltransferase involved in cell wall biosynthesis
MKQALFLFSTDRMGGAERVTRGLAREAALSGLFDRVHCFVLCLSRSGTLDELASLGNVSLHYTERGSQFRGIPSCIRFLSSQEFEFVFSSHALLNALCSALRGGGLLRARRLVTRESTNIFERDFGWRTPLVRALYVLYGFQDAVICQTTRMMESLRRATGGRFSEKCHVLMNPIDLQQIAADVSLREPRLDVLPKETTKIVWCGRMIPEKAPLRAIQTLERLRQLGQVDAHLIMIGNGPLEGEVRSFIEQRELGGCVTFMGHVARPVSIMRACRYGLITSDQEGFPNVLLEMLAAGVNGVVTTDCAGDLEGLPGVHVAMDKEPDALAKKLFECVRVGSPAQAESFLRRLSFKTYLERLVSKGEEVAA